MANSVDPYQSDLGLHCLHMPFVGNFGEQNFRTFTVPILAYKMAGWVTNGTDPDQMLHYMVSDLCLYCLLESFCLSKYGNLTFFRKQGLRLCGNCRLYAWNAKPYFCEYVKKRFKMSSGEIFTQQAKKLKVKCKVKISYERKIHKLLSVKQTDNIFNCI